VRIYRDKLRTGKSDHRRFHPKYGSIHRTRCNRSGIYYRYNSFSHMRELSHPRDNTWEQSDIAPAIFIRTRRRHE